MFERQSLADFPRPRRKSDGMVSIIGLIPSEMTAVYDNESSELFWREILAIFPFKKQSTTN
jgi:hypothetical protein